ncbi:unnamed protein product [Toxocara canis]|uniref:Sodium/nucleoside cotransporter n=1 Tax=Toxocara canis TaxID=6265 RepID=A0A183UE29_TOXCA|nr:unnamed protein product [Toxocara canis]
MADKQNNGYVNAAADIQRPSISSKSSGLPERFEDIEAAKASNDVSEKKQSEKNLTNAAADDDVIEPEYLDEEVTGPMRYVALVQNSLENFVENYNKHIKWGIFVLVVIAFHVYLVFALTRNFDRAEAMMIFTCIAWGITIYYCILKRYLGEFVYTNVYKPVKAVFDRLWDVLILRIIFFCLVIGAIIAFIVINWRPVCWGYFMQFIFGLAILRWEWGSDKFNKLAHYIVVFLDYTYEGTTFVYGFLSSPPNICGMSAVFAFSSIQVIIYFGAIVSLLYYYGIMQLLLKKMAWLMQVTLGTTATESFNACACIFLGQSEAPLLIKPYLIKMTPSEIHAIMTSGFSCIAGSLFAAYISFGACSTYLLSATVMSAPGSLACSKILYPETRKSQLTRIEDLDLPKGEESNALECISNGAVMAVDLVMAILANLIVFLALLAFANNAISWLIGLLGYEGWNLEVILGYAFFPLAYLMGVTSSTEQTLRVAQLMGTKTILNEFIAYQKLGQMVMADPPLLTPRSQMIATYALCGFSNISSIGIQLGILGGMVPTRKALLSKLAIRALMAGCISCFWTASLAGILVSEPISCPQSNASATCFNVTEYRDLLNNMSTTVTPTVSSSTFSPVLLKTEL